MKSFAQQMNDVIKKKKAEAKKITTSLCRDASYEIVTRTPIDTGNARANWNPAFNAYDDSVKPFDGDAGKGYRAPDDSLSSDLVMGRTNYVLTQKFKIGGTFTLTNGVEYMRKLNYESYSDYQQAEPHFIQNSAADVAQKYKKGK